MTTSNPGATNDSTNDSTGKDPTANDQTNNTAFGPFEAWQEMFKKSTEAWAQAASGFAGFTPPSPGAMPFGSFPFPPPFNAPPFNAPPFNAPPFNGFPFGPGSGSAMPGFESFFPSFNPAGLPQMWQQFFQAWTERLRQNQANPTFPQTVQDAERQWAQQLESLAATFAKSMSTEEFSQMLGKYMEQMLVWQERSAKQSNPQIDAALRAANLPSRSQIDRLFERIIGVEERLDDLEDAIRKLQGTVDASAAPRRASSFPPQAPGPVQP